MPLTTAYLGLGGNLGDRMANLREALRRLEAGGDVRVVRASRIYENRAVGMGDAAAFYNAVVEIQTHLEPEALLDLCFEIETSLGRVRSGGWAPRPIDLDLLHVEGMALTTERLTLPHPRIRERDFVAWPLAELAPELNFGGQTIREIADVLGRSELSPVAEVLGGNTLTP